VLCAARWLPKRGCWPLFKLFCKASRSAAIDIIGNTEELNGRSPQVAGRNARRWDHAHGESTFDPCHRNEHC
jgi:hypothetical protein